MKKRTPRSSSNLAAGDNDEQEAFTEPELEDCILCLEPMHLSDYQIPMLCPLDGCPFNYCAQCVWNLLLTTSQPYQEASDGSKQMKVPLQCPQCRTRYPHRQVLQDVLILRQVFRLEPLFLGGGSSDNPCSTLKASDLRAKQDLFDQVTFQALQESWARVNKYLKDRSHPQEGFEIDTITDTSSRIPPLPEQWKEHLLHEDADKTKGEAKSSFGEGQAKYDLVDPTLFQGMEETMTLSEQEFLSKLLVSGSASNLMLAAHILHGMVRLMLQGGVKARQNQSLNISDLASATNSSTNHTRQGSTGSAINSQRNFRNLALGTNLLYPDMDPASLRKRFPLPRHMPRWMVIPVYHPDRRGCPLQVKDHTFGLEITSVKGSAGQQGIRKGDIVTHINEEPCDSVTSEEFANYMRSLYEANKNQSQDAAATVSLVVNAHEDTALELQKRSFEIIHFLTEQREVNKASVSVR